MHVFSASAAMTNDVNWMWFIVEFSWKIWTHYHNNSESSFITVYSWKIWTEATNKSDFSAIMIVDEEIWDRASQQSDL